MIVEVVGLAIVSYLIGSIPTGVLIAKGFYRVDLRTVGSGNIGATNVYRALGAVPSMLVLIGDTLKGAVPSMLGLFIGGTAMGVPYALVCGAAAVAGHNWPPALRFRGGKGVATSLGVILVLFPTETAVVFLLFLVLVMAFRYVSLGSIAAAGVFALMVVARWWPEDPWRVGFAVIASGILLVRHRQNIGRLVRGEERRFGE